MIILVRVDNRLLHGQVLEAWVPRLKVRSILVADDAAARSPLAKAAMTLAVPPGLRVEIHALDEVDWAALAGSPEPTLVVLREVADLQRALVRGLAPQGVPAVNLGNVHFAPGRRAVTPSVFLSQPELDAVLGLVRKGFRVEARAVPADAPIDAETMVKRYKAAS